MKLNYRKLENGKRSTITLSDAIVNTWYETLQPDQQSGHRAEEELRRVIEATEDQGIVTFVAAVERRLMQDVVDQLRWLKEGLAVEKGVNETLSKNYSFRLEQEKDGFSV